MADDRIRWDEDPVRLGKKGFVTWKTAMHELNKRIGLLKNLHATVEDKTNIVNAISGVSDRVGNLTDLSTTSKTTIVAAINSVWSYIKNTIEKWLGASTEVEEKYITAHGDTVSKLVNYLLGRDEKVATSDELKTVSEKADSAQNAADNAQSTANEAFEGAKSATTIASSAQSDATAANTWLGSRDDMSDSTLAHGDNVSQIVEYLANNSGGDGAFGGYHWDELHFSEGFNSKVAVSSLTLNIKAGDVQTFSVVPSADNFDSLPAAIRFMGSDFPAPEKLLVLFNSQYVEFYNLSDTDITNRTVMPMLFGLLHGEEYPQDSQV